MLDTLSYPGDYIDGSFVTTEHPDEELVTRSPAELSDVVGTHRVSGSQVDRAVVAAQHAVPELAKLGNDGRRALLRRYQERLRAHEMAIAETISREAGKPLWDALTEAKALAAKVDAMLGEGARFTADEELTDLPGAIRYRPHGVMAVIGPFNFPAHLPNGQIVPALHLGNSVVFKPSEKTPNVAVWMARCFAEAGAPKGAFNVVQGGAPVAERLVDHEDIDAISFTGSVAVGKRVMAANLDRPGRLVALELGGKNASIVLDDCALDAAVRQVAFAAYASAGQRCTATSRVYVARAVADAMVSGLADAARRLRVGYVFDERVFMGPLINDASRAALFAAQARAREAGFEAVVPGGEHEVAGHEGYYVAPSVHLAPRPDVRVEGYTHDELFGPDVAVYVVDDLEQAIALANGTRYGLATSVFTASAATFEHAASHLRSGVVHWNRSTAGASGRLPFGGIKDSGNHRPAGITAGAFCAYPQAVFLAPPADAPLPKWPGLYD